MQNPRFLIMDSGVGGLTIAQNIQTKIPHCQITYLADNGAFPYGVLPEPVLVERLLSLLPPLECQYKPDIIVIACNTASTAVLDHLRQQTPTPIIGVVPAIKPAAAASQSKQLALLATPGTVSRHYTQDLIDRFASDCQVLKIGSNALVHEAENKLRGLPVNADTLSNELAPIIEANQNGSKVDTLILGCTHFPFLHNEIKRCLPEDVNIIDSGEAIARRALHVLQQLPESSKPHIENQFLFSANDNHAHTLEAGIKHLGFSKIRFLSQSTTQNTQKSGAS